MRMVDTDAFFAMDVFPATQQNPKQKLNRKIIQRQQIERSSDWAIRACLEKLYANG